MYDMLEVENTERVLYLQNAAVSYDKASFRPDEYRIDVKFNICGLSTLDQKPRWVKLTSHKAESSKLYVDNLRINFWQASQFGEQGKLISENPSYYDVYNVDLDTATYMAKTLKTFSKQMNAADDKLGYAQSSSEKIKRMCKIFGIKRIYIPAHNVSDLSKDEYEIMTIEQFLVWWDKAEQALMAAMKSKESLSMWALAKPLFDQ
jgi:hypothetical protein